MTGAPNTVRGPLAVAIIDEKRWLWKKLSKTIAFRG